MLYYIYILICSNDALYTGYTTDIKRRYAEHLSGSIKCKYTRSFPPKALAMCWMFMGELSEVRKIEYAIKRCTKREKLSLIQASIELNQLLSNKGFGKCVLDNLKEMKQINNAGHDNLDGIIHP